MIIETTIKVHDLKVLIDVPPEVHGGDARVAMREADFAARTLSYLIKTQNPHVGIENRLSLTGNHIEVPL